MPPDASRFPTFPMTLAELLNPSDLIATAVKAIIEADSPAFPLPVYARRVLGEMDVSRVEVEADGFARASDHVDWSGGTPFYNHYAGRLTFQVITARPDQATTDAHAYAVGRLRWLMSRPAQKLTSAALSGLVVLDCVDLGDNPEESEKTDTDRTRLSFDLAFIIPAAVYAAAT